MEKEKKIQDLRLRRRHRVRARIFGTAERPRLSVFKSQKNIRIQAIDDQSGLTLASASNNEVKAKSRMEQAQAVGKLIAEKLNAKKVKTAIFDKGHYKYHGLIKALADSAREGGLKF